MNTFSNQLSSIGNIADLLALIVTFFLVPPLCLAGVLMAIKTTLRIKKTLCNKPKKLAKVENNG